MASHSLITKSFKTVKHSKEKTQKKSADDAQPSTSNTDLEVELKVLKHFDVTLEFGPCTGITRMDRWERAEKHGLNPPLVVKEIVLRHLDDAEFTESLWKDYPL